MIIGISGKIGAGKDAVGSIIQYLTTKEAGVHTLKDLTEPRLTYQEFLEKFRTPYTIDSTWEIKKFAGKLKQIVSLLTGCTVEDLESQEFKNKQLPAEWDYVNKWLYGDTGISGNYPKSVETYKDDEIFKGNPKRFTHHYTYRDLLQKIGTNAMRDMIHENVWVNSLMADYKEYTRNTVEGTAEWDENKGRYIIKQVPLPELSDRIGQELMTDKWRAFIPERQETPNWIITDMRFPNELNAVEDRGGITIRVERKKLITSEIESSLGNSLGKVTWIPIPGVDTVAEHPSETALDNVPFKYNIDNSGTIEELVEKVKEILIKEKVI